MENRVSQLKKKLIKIEAFLVVFQIKNRNLATLHFEDCSIDSEPS